MHNINIGKYGETKAIEYLLKNKFVVLEKNYRYLNLEIDIIAKKNETIFFIEVKTRSNINYGEPIEAVNIKKLYSIKKVANYYIESLNLNNTNNFLKIQFDVICIKILNIKNNKIIIEKFEDLF